MEDDPSGRMKAARAAMSMTDEELMTWAVGRQVNDPVRQPIVEMELKRRSNTAVYKAAIAGAVVGAVVGAVLAGHWL
jgi:hypothetical protein